MRSTTGRSTDLPVGIVLQADIGGPESGGGNRCKAVGRPLASQDRIGPKAVVRGPLKQSLRFLSPLRNRSPTTFGPEPTKASS